jgi:undecaprenyl diphosphate synthase
MNGPGLSENRTASSRNGSATTVGDRSRAPIVEHRPHDLTPLDRVRDPREREALARLRRVSPIAEPEAQLGVPARRVPEHVAIIMDGNGRWAERRGLPRSAGHKAGAPRVRDVLTRAGQLGVGYLTLYSFSTENWNRPPDEVAALMDLYVYYLAKERDELVANNVRLKQIGRRDRLSPDAITELDRTLDATAGCTGVTLVLAVNYSSRVELTDAVRRIAERVRAGDIEPDDIDQAVLAEHLYTADLPDPDLLVRTGGEMRVSNYLLWQISYAEFFVTDTLWPDFDAAEFDEALRTYAARERRYGGVNASATDEREGATPTNERREGNAAG